MKSHGVVTKVLGFAAVLVALAPSGCTVHATGEPVGYVETTSAPVEVAGYPSAFYEGRTVYYVGDRWMYPDRGRWAYYRSEPAYLQRQRTYVQQAPPAYGRGRRTQGVPRAAPPAYGPGYRAPAAPRVGAPAAAPPAAAPPAVRVQ
jgi:hypothetical protein